MEGCYTIRISKKQSCLFPTLLQLSIKEVVAIWDFVSAYILGQMKLEKGVLVPGLGTFAVVHEQIHGKEELYEVRRPVFQLDMDMSCLQELLFPTVMIPGDIEIMPLDYWWLSQTNSLPPDVVRGCVEETILLYSFQLRDRQRPAFAFENIGILSCQDNVLCMQFHCSCIAGLESQDTWVALLLTRLNVLGSGVNNGVATVQGVQAHMFPRFQLAVSEDFSTQPTKAAEKQLVKTGEKEHPGNFSLPILPYQRPGMRQQEPGPKPPARYSAFEVLGHPTVHPSSQERGSLGGGGGLEPPSPQRKCQRDSSLGPDTFPHEPSRCSVGWSHIRHGGTSSCSWLRTTGDGRSSRGSSAAPSAGPACKGSRLKLWLQQWLPRMQLGGCSPVDTK
ncbi:coiled-coil domain-containing protein 81-like isoform X6 [Oenanthe melanoleuca]|uniref:coiled-coil domain-containing protein 81-like isoform X6 n=1 Tax=Oenanthe melanoleuca TaxID=2939378 RepID=UPI0024C15477|nr:coiled-coil domain-containing protein 81-like isoform X6 [Oenanthe melanoleuca]